MVWSRKNVSAPWEKTKEQVPYAIVSIKYVRGFRFDGLEKSAGEATGFVVDRKLGFILTCGHVVGDVTFCGIATFRTKEQCPVKVVYKDPVHDFAFLHFNTSKMDYYDEVRQLTLRPELARLNQEIMIIGNDQGEVLSIASGTISRIDCDAPTSLTPGDSDHNINYLQTATSVGHGASGSPVVEERGYCVGILCAGIEGAIDTSLPLNQPQKALECLQKRRNIPRGTLSCRWKIKPLFHCRRVGLSADDEALLKKDNPLLTDLLCADRVLQGSASDGIIEVGDILLKIEGSFVTKYDALSSILDSKVGCKITLRVHRVGKPVDLEVQVVDLHPLTPQRLFSFAGSQFAHRSFRSAMWYGHPTGGLVIAERHPCFDFDSKIPKGSLIVSINDSSTPDLDTFMEVTKNIRNGERIKISYKDLRHFHNTLVTTSRVTLQPWCETRLLIRDMDTGEWIKEPLAWSVTSTQKPSAIHGIFLERDDISLKQRHILRSLVTVDCRVSLQIDSEHWGTIRGTGLIVDAKAGYVIVPRTLVPSHGYIVELEVANVFLSGEIVFSHPQSNYTFVHYDPALITGPTQSAQLSARPVKKGDTLNFLGHDRNNTLMYARVTVMDKRIHSWHKQPDLTFCPTNEEMIVIDKCGATKECQAGVLVDEDGVVCALWVTFQGTEKGAFRYGISAHQLAPTIRRLQTNSLHDLRIIDVRLRSISLPEGRAMGVGEEIIQEMGTHKSRRHQLLLVEKQACNHTGFLERDVIVRLNDNLVTCADDLVIPNSQDVAQALVFRDGVQKLINVHTVTATSYQTKRFISVCGLIVQHPPYVVQQHLSGRIPRIYVSYCQKGSVGQLDGLAHEVFITGINGKEVTDFDDFVDHVFEIPDGKWFDLRLIDTEGVESEATLHKDENFSPTVLYTWEPTRWLADPTDMEKSSPFFPWRVSRRFGNDGTCSEVRPL